MDTDELIRSELRTRHPALDVDRAWSDVQQRTVRARRWRSIVLAAAAVAVLAGGGALVAALAHDGSSTLESTDPAGPATGSATPEPGDVATWTIDPAAPPSPEASSISVLVTRLGCSGGITGEVLRPGVVVDGSQVLITFNVEDLGPGAFECPGNDAVPYEVDLGQPLGDRILLDGACTESDGAGGTSFCEGGAVRWPLDGGSAAGRHTVSGLLMLVGGPVGAEPVAVPGDIDVFTLDGEIAGAVPAADDGSFEVDLTPGTYLVVGRSPQYDADDATCEAEVEVRDGDVTDVVVACQMR